MNTDKFKNYRHIQISPQPWQNKSISYQERNGRWHVSKRDVRHRQRPSTVSPEVPLQVQNIGTYTRTYIYRQGTRSTISGLVWGRAGPPLCSMCLLSGRQVQGRHYTIRGGRYFQIRYCLCSTLVPIVTLSRHTKIIPENT